MTVDELVKLVQLNYQTSITDATLIHYINMVEDTFYSEIVGTLNIEPFTYEIGDIDSDGTEVVEPQERYQFRPVEKTEADRLTQVLDLTKFGKRWAEIYEYYLYSRMALLNKDFEDYQNYAAVYNELHDDFIRFYFSRRSTPRMNWR